MDFMPFTKKKNKKHIMYKSHLFSLYFCNCPIFLMEKIPFLMLLKTIMKNDNLIISHFEENKSYCNCHICLLAKRAFLNIILFAKVL